MKKFRCPICGYIHEGDTPPESCPVCKAPGSKFVELEETRVWAAEHVVGVGKKIDPRVIEGLRSNFTGECTEVGMYLAMARAAFREGYAEIGMYWEKAAYEEAEHAAKFAELLGEVVSSSTKENLQKRVAAENGVFDIGIDGKGQVLPMHQILAHRVAPMHGVPFRIIGMILVEQVIPPAIPAKTVGIVHPSDPRGEMEKGT